MSNILSTCFSEYFLPVAEDTQPRFIQFCTVVPPRPVSADSCESVSPPVALRTGSISEKALSLAESVYSSVVPGINLSFINMISPLVDDMIISQVHLNRKSCLRTIQAVFADFFEFSSLFLAYSNYFRLFNAVSHFCRYYIQIKTATKKPKPLYGCLSP